MHQQEILVLGSSGSGKSLMLRRLKEIFQNSNVLSNDALIPTVGMDVSSVVHTYLAPTRKEMAFNIREVGSALSSRWKSYISYANVVIFTIDASDISNIATVTMLLYEVLFHWLEVQKQQSDKISTEVPKNAVSTDGCGCFAFNSSSAKVHTSIPITAPTHSSFILAFTKTDLLPNANNSSLYPENIQEIIMERLELLLFPFDKYNIPIIYGTNSIYSTPSGKQTLIDNSSTNPPSVLSTTQLQQQQQPGPHPVTSMMAYSIYEWLILRNHPSTCTLYNQ